MAVKSPLTNMTDTTVSCVNLFGVDQEIELPSSNWQATGSERH